MLSAYWETSVKRASVRVAATPPRIASTPTPIGRPAATTAPKISSRSTRETGRLMYSARCRSVSSVVSNALLMATLPVVTTDSVGECTSPATWST